MVSKGYTASLLRQLADPNQAPNHDLVAKALKQAERLSGNPRNGRVAKARRRKAWEQSHYH